MRDLKELIREVLLTNSIKPDCGCGCKGTAKCFDAPVLNENLKARIVMTENMQYHIDAKTPLFETTIPYGSKEYLDLWAEARYLYSRGALNLEGIDKEKITETHLGEYGIYEGKKVPLDMPMLDEEQMLDGYKVNFFNTKANVYANIEIPSKNPTFENDIQIKGTGKTEEEAFIDLKQNYNNYKKTGINEAKYQGRTVTLNKPSQGDSKKFKVYVKNDKGKVIKVNFGFGGKSAKGKRMVIKDKNPKRRAAFRARHNCKNPGPRTKARYWSCKKW
jgi:hypothetical protein